MGALAWLIIPVVAVLVAAAWASWAQRAPKATGDPASLAEHRRFMAAMERTTAGTSAPGEHSGR
ncbi:hypothetical protein HS99_0031545 [Kitasatospora aureofaciens]|uniref:Uncharacterized protein n=1 Tax=Kitasatospora aureofaciens TaxID=1894 RepID=A0A1E7N5T5_KITAU|nr:hypothetical protein [Kitasatospora aureofaciens]QEV00001.1 hypothetical protein CP971_12525 [Streptomyces viridifaciens]ARF78795.1 hypothetical protein B6264_07580 [Kitasatospora aureofaciens]OEV36039.1 hypothetical protein HS99_0031545 [Kitasatospora aureofaciens]UKZ06172.1 hypothetical protein BOQ63_019410 [Streptomyces viridifaciens]GGU77279.1 hypothetical protein GCM10010502_31490 [Kitasatospora aureofaciens]